jgi:hypothetical protein
VLAGCYAPEAQDCTVSCKATDSCAAGQVCGSDGLCASPEVAGHCNGVDGGIPLVSLRITIEGHGKVNIDGVGGCDSDSESEGKCTFAVPANLPRDLKAIANQDRVFVAWTSTCVGTSPTCTLTPVMLLTQVGAKFE